MRIVMVMYDTLNRHWLPNYGCEWTKMPNFKRLADRTVTFDRSYVCSMPCMPARRDLHTGRPNFLHRSWGPIEPFDVSVFELLKNHKVYSHLTTDHYHYFEDGGLTYHQRYDTWQFNRGQEGDPWVGQIADSPKPEMAVERGGNNRKFKQDWKNRAAMPYDHQHYQSQTFQDGLEFMRVNREQQDWVLQIETFDPHEPYFSHRQWKDRYPEHFADYKGKHMDWPPYTSQAFTDEEGEHCRYELASLMSKCDAHLGDILDLMDAQDMWDDTMLIVWTDHGFFMGERDMMWGKCWMPFYETIAHTPFFVWDPRCGRKGERRDALVQPSIDLAPTMLGAFGIEPDATMLGKDLAPAIADDTPVREAGIFGIHGKQVNVTDGRYVYMRGPADLEANEPLFDYTLMPTHMTRMFQVNELQDVSLAAPFNFTQGCSTLKIPTKVIVAGKKGQTMDTVLWDVQNDPDQRNPLDDPDIESKMIDHLVTMMKECDAPPEQYERLGLTAHV